MLEKTMAGYNFLFCKSLWSEGKWEGKAAEELGLLYEYLRWYTWHTTIYFK